jgi:prepilin-type N-terminal cleavage/methylation domain-containing protein
MAGADRSLVRTPDQPAGSCGLVGRSGLRGFTLLEVLVALSVMGIVLAALAQIGGVTARSGKIFIDNVEAGWTEEQLAIGVVEQLKLGRAPEIPEALALKAVSNPDLSSDQRDELGRRGLDLVDVTLVSIRSGRTAWQGQLLVSSTLLAEVHSQ